MHVYMYVCMQACMYVRMYACMKVQERCEISTAVVTVDGADQINNTCMYVCMYICMYVCKHACMYAYMYACKCKNVVKCRQLV